MLKILLKSYINQFAHLLLKRGSEYLHFQIINFKNVKSKFSEINNNKLLYLSIVKVYHIKVSLQFIIL
ncbi:unnamed protein product (macronuclear) [Paramecium tetraurelia]|uniref:Uncharacterized protein n=1 Tax=Paramecium tetraurelia TaxID=5888 RepID=A0BE26_PARTE|nr:uncharacterized protein GSPATT00027825001 [Paramecium tetraurelia]CAK56793.1 unnamed protein product [Paramecium tetraurelia]|eukprot:XP_001424191.1 hypothetical protein (macronuclear) [Paramecium tetraurelia strain d4-2]